MRDPDRPRVREDWRTIPAQAIEELLLLGGYAIELGEGGRADAVGDLRRLLGAMPAADDPGERLNAMIEQGLRGENSFWLSRYVATGRRMAAALWQSPDADVPDLSALPPRSFRVEFRRTFNLAHARAGSRTRLRMPLPIEDAQLTDLRVTVAPTVAQVRPDQGRIEATPATAADGPLTLAASFSFTARPGLPHGIGDPGDLAIWLSEREGPIQVTDRVRALADRLDRGPVPGFEQVMAYRDHLIDHLACGMIHAECLSGPAGMDWVLDAGWFDCRVGSAMLAALCRARGIPARLIGGYLLWEAPAEHYWIEAWLPDRGWTAFDLLAWDLSAGGRDQAWRKLFAGTIDYRMKTQVFPERFTGAPGVAMRAPWHRLSRAIPGGAETRFVAIPGGDLLYADAIQVFKA